jgi:tetratricopeptide (TPR) repeat protein
VFGIIGFCLVAPESVFADAYTTLDGRRAEAKILAVNGSTMMVSLGAAQTLGVPLRNVRSVEMPVPLKMVEVQKLVAEGKYEQALNEMQSEVSVAIGSETQKFKQYQQYRGIPLLWVRQALSTTAGLFLALNKFEEAEKAYKDLQTYYTAGGSLEYEVGMARIAVAKGDGASVKGKLEEVTQKALADKAVSREAAGIYSQAFLALGQLREKEGELSAALESYLRTVALFPQDASAAAVAQERADGLISKKVTVP